MWLRWLVASFSPWRTAIPRGQSGFGTGFALSVSFHPGSPYSYITWGMNRPISGHSSDTVSPHQLEHVHAHKRTTVLGASLYKRRWILFYFSEVIHTYMTCDTFSSGHSYTVASLYMYKPEMNLVWKYVTKSNTSSLNKYKTKEQSTFDVISGFHKNYDNADQLKNLGK
jgi:hypothetical protein